MKPSEKKLKLTLKTEDLGMYFRQMANALEGQPVEEFVGLIEALQDYSKVELKIKRKQNEVDVKLKAKSSLISNEVTQDSEFESGSDTTDEEKPKYKKLKKRMKSSFKAIAESLSHDTFPEALTVKSFIADSELMISYSGYGDEYYPVYREELLQFAKAFENRDLEAIKQAYSRLNQLKSDCHDRYK
jgi:XXXCH domain-containing protein